MYGVLGGKAVSVSDPEFVALMQQLANGGIDASGNAWEAWSDRNESALMEPKLSGVRAGLEAAAKSVEEGCPRTKAWSKRTLWLDRAAQSVRSLSAESIAKESQHAAE